MSDETTDFRAGYEAAKRDAIERCLMERVPNRSTADRTWNVAVGLCVVAIRDLDVRNALPAKRQPSSTAE